MIRRLTIAAVCIAGTVLMIEGIGSGSEDLRKRDDSYMDDATIKFRALKNVYEPNEPVPLIVAIANHRSEPIYVYGRDPELLGQRRARVTNANGVDMPYDRPSEQLSLPSDHYMKIDGRSVQVAPISRISPRDVAICWMPDGLERYHGHLPEGEYFLEMHDFLIVHEIDDLITRSNNKHLLWFQTKTTSITRCFHPVDGRVKIEIRKKDEK